MTEITTIIPTFRRPSLLKRAILSALDQDVSLQVCVFDNCSGDETARVVADLASVDSRLRYHCHERNLGATSNFLYGMRSVDTPYFSILSDDDYLLPGFYKRALSDLSSHPDAMFWAGLTLNVSEHGVVWLARILRWPREGRFTPPEGLMRMMHGASPTTTGIVFRRDVLANVGFLDEETLGPADLDYLLRISARYPFLLHKVPSAIFTMSSTSFSASQPLASFWPGWQKMFRNLESTQGLDPRWKAEALAALHEDAKRMLFRRGANALAEGRYDFARDSAAILRDQYRQSGRARLLRMFASACERCAAAKRVYTAAYRFAERVIVKSRGPLHSHYGHLVKRDE